MLFNIIKITIRNIWKSKIYVIINLLGMALAIACCILAYVNYQYSATWDKHHDKVNELFRVQSVHEFQDKPHKYAMAPLPLGPNIFQNVSEVDDFVRLKLDELVVDREGQLFKDKIAYVDDNFFKLFTYSSSFGDFSNLNDPNSIYISERIAIKYFGRKNVVGELISQRYHSEESMKLKEFVVKGVFKPSPENSSFDFEIISVFDNYVALKSEEKNVLDNWREWVDALFIYVKKPEKNKVANIENQIQRFIAPQNKVRSDFQLAEYYLVPLNGMSKANLDTPRINNETLKVVLLDSATFVPSIMAIFLLLLTCFNFINTSIARSENRLKEIGIRKVLGGRKSQLISQFMLESFFLCFLSLLFGLIIAKIIVPFYSDMWSWLTIDVIYSENFSLLLFILILITLVTVISGLYPSYFISSFQPVKILKGRPKFGDINWFTRLLLGAQFCISMIVIAMALAFYQNGDYQKNFNLGFSTKEIISARTNTENNFIIFRDALLQNPDIEVIAGTDHHLANSLAKMPVSYNEKELIVDTYKVGFNYLNFMDIELIEGRPFRENSETDFKESIVVNEKFVSEFKITNPINTRVLLDDSISYFIIGVIKNIHPRGLWDPIEPIVFKAIPEGDYKQLLVKAAPSKESDINSFMHETWINLFPESIYEGSQIESQFEETIVLNENISVIFSFLGIMTVILTSISLYTLVSLNINRKLKVIGIRKVLGASRFNIAWSINREFIYNLLISVVLGGIFSYFLIEMIMHSIWEYYIGLTGAVLIPCVMIMILILLISVAYKTFKVAAINPVKTLRME